MEFTRSATFSSIKFPQLAPRYQGMPRRYEETKPVVIQDFTHRKIVGIGHEIQSRLLDRLDVEKADAIEQAKLETWEEAEKKKQSAVRRVRDEAAVQIKKALEEQSVEHEQRIKEEVVHVEMAMQKQSIEQVQVERAKGEKAQAAAIKEVEQRCAKELEKAVAEAHKKEQHIAAENIKNLTQNHNSLLEDMQKAHVVELASELALLTAEKDKQREDAVNAAHEFEQKVTQDITQKLRQKFEKQSAQESVKINAKNFEISRIGRRMEEIEKEKERLAEYLQTTRKSFQDFIDRVQKMKNGEADFMLPPAYINEIERGLMEAE
ncbi:uncharacterized protein C6orf163 homolog [Littorina saxatilis]|uniref:Uncharacterized protein n=1 Tax=Littorina saxatilis TaxID=31220 RepID=A0AAN9BRZ0_9CAEN